MRFTVPRLRIGRAVIKKCNISSVVQETRPTPFVATKSGQTSAQSSFQHHIIFPRGSLGTINGFLRAQHRRNEDGRTWNQLILLNKYGPYHEALVRDGVLDPDDSYWRSVASSVNIYDALQRLVADHHLSFVDHPLLPEAESLYANNEPSTKKYPPTWLTLHLIANRVSSPRHAILALDLALDQLRRTKPPYRFPMLLLAIYRLQVLSQGSHLLENLDKILQVDSTMPEFHFNELLAICGRLPKDEIARAILFKVLERMSQLSIRVNPHIASRLAIHRLAYPELSQYLPLKARISQHWGHAYRPHYHVPRGHTGSLRRSQTRRMARLNISQVLQTLIRGNSAGRALRLDPHEWSSLVSAIGRDASIDAETMRAFWYKVQAYRGSQMDIVTQTAMMDAFRQRNQYDDALKVWDRILKTTGSIDRRALTAAVMSFCGVSRYKEAFETMDAFAFKDYLPAGDDPAWPVAKAQWIESRGRVKLDVAIINGFMDRLNRGGRPDVVFKLWDVMEKYYSVWPDGITMAILLDSARRASLIDPTIELALGQLGIFNPFNQFWAKKRLPETPSAAISQMLEKPPESGFWHGDWAFITARVIFRDAVLGNWPHLQSIACPVGAYTPSTISDRLWVTKDPAPELRWPTILPIDKTFHAYIFLLGWNELQAEIPLALAWMRALGIKPLHKTLCAALMYFGEVARLPPLFESFELRKGQEYGGDYGKLRRWIADWVGESALPSENAVAAYRRGDGQQTMRWYGRKY